MVRGQAAPLLVLWPERHVLLMQRRLDPRWTNASVRALAGDDDPVAAVTARARATVIQAMDQGWAGPPFDPVALAEILGIDMVANGDVRDARTSPIGRGRIRIEFNPNRPRGRMRYSIAHEIAHTLFPDVADRVRNRSLHEEMEGDEWQLEALCNIAAAEFLMPLGAFAPPQPETLTIRDVLDLQRRFDVSTEALVIRLAESSDTPIAAFCASPRGEGVYHLDYVVPSRAWRGYLPRRLRLPRKSVVHECTAIGYSAHGIEAWSPSAGPAEVQAVGIPPYPGGIAPRVVGLLKLATPEELPDRTPTGRLEYVYGSATEPRGEGPHLIVQVVNDKTPNWGGGGFASAIRRTWPEVQDDFRDWAEHTPGSYRLGAVRISRVDERTSVASVVAQHGYGPSAKPRIRYAALRSGLAIVARTALEQDASVHMPRIGTGQAGGQWAIVQDLVKEALSDAGVPVTVYDLPGAATPTDPQTRLDLPPSRLAWASEHSDA